jgi:hypothetical protein
MGKPFSACQRLVQHARCATSKGIENDRQRTEARLLNGTANLYNTDNPWQVSIKTKGVGPGQCRIAPVRFAMAKEECTSIPEVLCSIIVCKHIKRQSFAAANF